MRLLYVFSAIVAAVSGTHQPAAAHGELSFANAIDSEFMKDALAHSFDTIKSKEGQDVCGANLYVGASLPRTTLNKVNEQADGLDLLGPMNCKNDAVTGYNAMGYDFRTNFIFAVTDHDVSTDKHHIVRIDRYGCSENVAELGHLGNADHSGTRHIAGDISNGDIFWVGQKQRFRAVALQPTDGVHAYFTWEFPVCTSMNDFAFSPATHTNGDTNNLNGDAFGWDMGENKFCRFSPGTSVGQNPNPEVLDHFGVQFDENAIIGGLFFDHEGSVWIYDNKNDILYKFTGLDAAVGAFEQGNDAIITQELKFHVNGQDNANNIDGCSCVQSPGLFVPPNPAVDSRCYKRAL